MAHLFAIVVISNPMKPWLLPMSLRCRVDSRAMMLSLTETISKQLEFNVLENRTVVLEDGSKKQVPYVGPVRIDFENHSSFTCAFVLGNEAMLGAVHVSEIDFVIHHTPFPFSIRTALV